MLARKDIDAVVISVPDHWHARMVLDALAAGKHVYIEKPMTYRIPEGRLIIEAVKKTGKLLMVGSQGKTSPLTAKAREVVKTGVLGKLNMARLADYRNSPEGAWVYPIPSDASPQTIDWARWLGSSPKLPFDPKRFFRWRCWWEYSGGVTTDLWVHQFTTFHEIMDVKGPQSAVAQGGIYRWKDGRTCPDLMTAVFEYPDCLLEITANLGNSRPTTGLTISGSEGSLTFGSETVLVTFEPPYSEVASYGLNGWPKELRQKYLESVGQGGAAAETAADQDSPGVQGRARAGASGVFHQVAAGRLAEQGECRGRAPRSGRGAHRQPVAPEGPPHSLGSGDGQADRGLRPASARGAVHAFRRLSAIASAILAPWKRPFSMKISLVCMPATSTPARYIPERALSSVSGSV